MGTTNFINLTDARTRLSIAICGGAIVGMKTISKQDFVDGLFDVTEEEHKSLPEEVVMIDCAESNCYTVSESVAEITEKLTNLDWD